MIKKEEQSALLKALIQQNEKEFLKEFYDIFYGEDKNIPTVKAIVGEIYIYLEALLNNTLQDVFLKTEADINLIDLFNSEILDKINITRKIKVLEASKRFDQKIIHKAFKIAELRNKLLHLVKDPPLYDNENILNNKKTIIKKVIADFVEITKHVTEVRKQYKKPQTIAGFLVNLPIR